jgi:hypothetical protein
MAVPGRTRKPMGGLSSTNSGRTLNFRRWPRAAHRMATLVPGLRVKSPNAFADVSETPAPPNPIALHFVHSSSSDRRLLPPSRTPPARGPLPVHALDYHSDRNALPGRASCNIHPISYPFGWCAPVVDVRS